VFAGGQVEELVEGQQPLADSARLSAEGQPRPAAPLSGSIVGFLGTERGERTFARGASADRKAHSPPSRKVAHAHPPVTLFCRASFRRPFPWYPETLRSYQLYRPLPWFSIPNTKLRDCRGSKGPPPPTRTRPNRSENNTGTTSKFSSVRGEIGLPE